MNSKPCLKCHKDTTKKLWTMRGQTYEECERCGTALPIDERGLVV